MKKILISIQPEFVSEILNGKKTMELRTTAPKVWLDWFKNIGDLPEEIKVYIYCIKNKSKKDELVYIKDPLNIVKPFYVFGNEYGHKTNLNGKIVGEFTLKHMDKFNWQNGCLDSQCEYLQKRACISPDMLDKYSDYYHKTLYAYYIYDLKVYDKPKELSEFYSVCKLKEDICECKRVRHCKNHSGYECLSRLKPLTKAPQSWCYVEEN